MNKEDILARFTLPNDSILKEHLNDNEKAFYEAYQTAASINNGKNYVAKKIKGIKLRENNCIYSVICGVTTKLFGFCFNLSNGKLYRTDTDINIICKPKNLTLKRYYVSDERENISKQNLLGKNWLLEYETNCIYENSEIHIYFADGQKDMFVKENGKFICKSINSYSKIIKEDLQRQQFILQKQNLLYIFAFDGRLKAIGDLYGNFIEVIYKINGFIERVSSSFGMALNFYYENNMLSCVVDNIGRCVRYNYENNMLSSVIYQNGRKHTYYYEQRLHKLSQIINSRGITIFKAEYDKYGVPIRISDNITDTINIEYNKAEKKTVLSSSNDTLIYKYDEHSFINEISHSTIGTVYFTYDKKGNITSKTNTKGDLTLFEYDEYGRLTHLKLSNLSEIYYEYAEEHFVKLHLSTGYYKVFDYEKKGGLVNVKMRLDKGINASIKYSYDALGRLLTKTDENRNTICFEYKNEFSVNADVVTYPNNFKIYYEYDEVGRTIKTIFGKEVYERKYNNIDLVIQNQCSLGFGDFRRYDLEGNLKEVILPQENSNSCLGMQAVHKYQYEYDEKDVLIKVIAPDGSIYEKNIIEEPIAHYKTIKKFTLAGKVEQEWIPMKLDDNNNLLYKHVLYEYDKCLQVVVKKIGYSYVLKDKKADYYYKLQYQYDKLGNKISLSTPSQNIKYTYSDKNKLQKEIKQNGFDDVKIVYEYTTNGLLYKIKKFLKPEYSVKNDKNESLLSFIKIETIFVYDYNNNLIEIQLPNKNSIHLKYDLNGNMVKTAEAWFLEQEYKNELTVFQKSKLKEQNSCFRYDIAGRIVNVVNNNGILAEYEYDCFDNLTQIADKNGLTKFIYDKALNIIKIIYSDNSYELFEYSCSGNVIKHTNTDGMPTSYTYNSINKIYTITTDESTIVYQYDETGNVFNDI